MKRGRPGVPPACVPGHTRPPASPQADGVRRNSRLKPSRPRNTPAVTSRPFPSVGRGLRAASSLHPPWKTLRPRRCRRTQTDGPVPLCTRQLHRPDRMKIPTQPGMNRKNSPSPCPAPPRPQPHGSRCGPADRKTRTSHRHGDRRGNGDIPPGIRWAWADPPESRGISSTVWYPPSPPPP